MVRRFAAALSLALLLAQGARADTVKMKDGRELEGTVVEENATCVKLRVARGKQYVVVELPIGEVKEVRKLPADRAKLEAEAQQALASGQKEDAVRILRQLVSERPQDAHLVRDLAFAELMSEDLAHAKEDYARAAALDSLDIESLMGLGYVSAKTGDRAGAIEAYRKATAAGPRHTKAWLELGRLLLDRNAKGDADEVVRIGRQALIGAPNSTDAALLVAEGYQKATGTGSEDDRKKALPFLESFLKEHGGESGSPRVARRAAEIAAEQGEPARARAAIAIVIAARPEISIEEREGLLALEAVYAWIAAGRPSPPLGIDVLAEKLDLEAAARRFERAADCAPGEGEIVLASARLAARRGHLLEAVEHAVRATKELPPGASRDDATLLAEALRKLARATLALEPGATLPDPDTDPAPATLARAKRLAELLPFAASAREELARMHESAGDYEKARDEFKAAKERAPESEKKRLETEEKRVEAIRARKERNKDL